MRFRSLRGDPNPKHICPITKFCTLTIKLIEKKITSIGTFLFRE
jgi:hypothetical protein